MSWSECLKEEWVRLATPDVELAKSLKSPAQNWLNYALKHKVDENNSSPILSNLYEAFREICEAIGVLKGYKFYNHECITYFLKNNLNEENISLIFDKYRRIRNKINYYGFKVPPEVTKMALLEIPALIKQLKEKYLKDIK